MGIDELLNFIESKDNKKSGNNTNGKKSKKKGAGGNAATSSTNTSSNLPANIPSLPIGSTDKKRLNTDQNINKQNLDSNHENVISCEDDSEFEDFKNKLKLDSIDAKVIKKIKPSFTSKWD